MEKVTVLARFLETDGLQNNQVIQTALAHAFCLLIGSVEDINAAVAQRATQYLETIKYAAIKVFFFSSIFVTVTVVFFLHQYSVSLEIQMIWLKFFYKVNSCTVSTFQCCNLFEYFVKEKY